MGQASAFDALLTDICVRMGWCGSNVDGERRHLDVLIPEAGPITADQFVRWVFEAEGVPADAEPNRWQEQQGALRAAFVRHMGGETVDAALLKVS